MPAKSSSLVTDSPVCPVSFALAAEIGQDAAMFLQQLFHFLQTRKCYTHKGRRWWRHSIEDWIKRFYGTWSRSRIKRVIEILTKKLGIVLVEKLSGELLKLAADQTNWYSIDYEKLAEINVRVQARIQDFRGQENAPEIAHPEPANDAQESAAALDMTHGLKMNPPLVQDEPMIYKSDEEEKETTTQPEAAAPKQVKQERIKPVMTIKDFDQFMRDAVDQAMASKVHEGNEPVELVYALTKAEELYDRYEGVLDVSWSAKTIVEDWDNWSLKRKQRYMAAAMGDNPPVKTAA